MEINDIYKVKIVDTNENGAGIAKIQNAVVFVPNSVYGDIADIRITSVKKNYALGECLNLISPSEHRIKPLCPHSNECGGCTLGFVSYEYENVIKKNTVRAAFRRSNLPYELVGDTIYDSARTSYRNKIVLHYSKEINGFGFCRENSNTVIPFEKCLLCPDIINSIVNFINKNIRLIANKGPESLQIRTQSSGAVTVSFYCGVSHNEELSELIMKNFLQIDKVLFINRESKEKNSRTYDNDMLCGLNLIFSTEGFRQVNDKVFLLLIERIYSFAAQKNFSTALDLYCGSGIIGLLLAKKIPNATFYGVEINPDSIADAKRNAEENNLGNIKFFCGDASSFKKSLPVGEKPELIVVDPPRAGLSHNVKQELSSISPERIIYVSCNPQTLARDIAELCKNGYELKTAIPFNMFPMTKHVETVVLLSREKAKEHIHFEVNVADLPKTTRTTATYTKI